MITHHSNETVTAPCKVNSWFEASKLENKNMIQSEIPLN